MPLDGGRVENAWLSPWAAGGHDCASDARSAIHGGLQNRFDIDGIWWYSCVYSREQRAGCFFRSGFLQGFTAFYVV